MEGAAVYEVGLLEPGTVATRPVPLARAEFQRALRQLAREVRSRGSALEAARELLKAHGELEGEWLAEVSRGRVHTLVPLGEFFRMLIF